MPKAQMIKMVPKQCKKKGLLLMIIFLAVLFLPGIAVLILKMLSVYISKESPELFLGIVLLFKMVLTFYKIIFLLLLLFIPLAIYFLTKKEFVPSSGYDQNSGKGKKSHIPSQIRTWNWGAAGLTWIWGAYYSVWFSFLALIPVLNIFVMLFLGAKGSEMAWKSTPWVNVAEFERSQTAWKIWGILGFAVSLIFSIVSVWGMIVNGG